MNSVPHSIPSTLATLITMAVRLAGSFEPGDCMLFIEEDLTVADDDLARHFLDWLSKNNKTFGHNLPEVWSEYAQAHTEDKIEAACSLSVETEVHPDGHSCNATMSVLPRVSVSIAVHLDGSHFGDMDESQVVDALKAILSPLSRSSGIASVAVETGSESA